MAQAARLHLRMQKEIKRLQDDPPHGVSFNENGLSSLSSIEARIKGPEGTVYAKGVFILKIQIPERYPFQPPNVTFVTPIYHPNIDNGGRICLDILNLPPKGAWQPSLNIATVLISIGLLLSEPNPDDGLMAEISREFKYNRQVFDINAQLWTEKYASPSAVGASCWGSVDAGALAQNTEMENTESQKSLPNSSKKDCEWNQRKMRLLGQKLSLKSERSEENTKTVKQDPVGSHLQSMAGSTYPTASFPDVSGRQDDMSQNMSVGTASVVASKKEYQGNNENLQLPGQRHSVASDAPSVRNDGNGVLPNHLPASASDANDHVMQSSDDILVNSLPRSIGGSSDSSYKPPEGNRRNIRTLGLKLSLKSMKPEKKSDDDQKENMAPSHLPPQQGFNKSQKRPLDAVSKKQFSGGPALVQQNPVTERQQSNNQVVLNEECNQGRKKLCSLSRRLALKSEQPVVDSACDKDYKPPNCSISNKKPNELPLSAPPSPIPKGESMAPNELPLMAPAVLKSQAKALGFAGGQKDTKPGNSVNPNALAVENLVVSDSEDSEEERERPPRSRLSLVRRRLAGKLRT